AQATALLARTEGQVDDDAVRVAVADGAAALGALLADRPAETSGDAAAGPSAGPSSVAARITAAAADLRAATAALSDAHGTWLAEEEARAAEAAAAARAEEEARAAAAAAAAGAEGDGSAGRPAPSRAAGAGPDCGGPDSYEPPTGTATFYTSTPSETGDGSNGRLPRSAMSALGWCVDARGNAQWLRADAAAALTRLNEAFRAAFGENVAVDMSYRSYEDQVAMREHYGGVAARPGTSNHGWGTAFDTWEWSAYAFGSARYEWLVTNAPAYGWVAPSWARQGGSNPEYWHFEYVG
ncbi:M15 family metallopeptidase, partial [Actinotalea sp. AC32]|nr:M15 family metallopeptidase [Actinotalea sp. AC32]